MKILVIYLIYTCIKVYLHLLTNAEKYTKTVSNLTIQCIIKINNQNSVYLFIILSI
jgi:hypothetical protein